MKTIVNRFNGFSMNSVDNVFDTCKKIFLDSDIAIRVKLGLIKATCIANCGIITSFLMLLCDGINKPPAYTLSFDEILNKVTKECKMDQIIHSWDDDNMVKVRYLGSSFVWSLHRKKLDDKF